MTPPQHRNRHRQSLPALRASLAALATVTLLAACGGGAGAGPEHSAPSRSAAPASRTPTRPSAAPSTRSRAEIDADVARVVRSVPDGAAAVSAVNIDTGASYTAGYRKPIWTASMYKLLVLETLLRQQGPLSGGTLAEARTMIENSDNAAGWSLWQAGGGNTGLQATLRALKATHSTADGTDPTFTRMTAADAVRMVRALVRPGVLSAAARRQALQLMRNVEADQRWGVGAAADKGTDVANKNGWLSIDNSNPAGEDDGGRWAVNSVGVVTVHGQQVLMAAMSMHNASLQDGITVIQALAKDAAAVVAP